MLQRKVRSSSTSDAAEPTSTSSTSSSSASLVSVVSEDRLPSLESWTNDACDDVTLASDPSTFSHPYWPSPPSWTLDSTPSDSVIPRVKRKQGRIEGAIVAPADGHRHSTSRDDDDSHRHRQYPDPPHHEDRWLRLPRHQNWSSSSSSSTSPASSAAKTCCRGLQRLFSAYALTAIAVWCSLLASIGECQAAPPNYSVYKMPDTDFDCRNKVVGGYYADPQAFCQMFHVCVQVGQSEVRDFRFLCPNDTVFDQKNFICANWWEVECGPSNATSSSSSSERPSPGSSSAAPSSSSSSSSSSTASFVSSTTPFPSSLPPNAAVGIVNKGTPIRGSTAAPETKPAAPQKEERPTDSNKSDNQQQTEYDYLYYEDVPPEYEYEYVDANGNVYPAPNPPQQELQQQQQQQNEQQQQQQPQKQDQGNKRPPQVQSSTTRPQPPGRNHQQGGDHFSDNRDSSLGLSQADEGGFFPPANNDQQRRPSAGSQSSSFFFSGPSSTPFPPAHQRPQGQPSPAARPSTKGDAGNQQHQQLRRPLPPSRPEAVEDFISTKVQQPSKESVAFVSSGKLSGASGGDSGSGFFSVREHHHASKDRQKQLHPSSVSSHSSQQRLSSGGSNRFFDDLPPLGDDPSALGPPPPHKARPAKSSNKKPGPQIHTYSEVNRPKSSYFVSTQLSAPTDGNHNGAGGDRHRHNQHQHHHQSGRNSRKNDDLSTDGADGGAAEQDEGEKVEKVETEVKDRYHHIVHHRDGEEGFRYHYQETPVRKVTSESDAESLDGSPEPSAPATDRAAIIDTEPPVDLLGRSSSLTAPSNVEHHDTSSRSDSHDGGHGSPHHHSSVPDHLPDLFSVPGEAIAADSSTFPELHRAVSVSKTETQGPLLRLSSSSRRSTAKNVKVAGSDNDSRSPFPSPGAADAGEVSVIVSRTSSSSSPRASVLAGPSSSPSALPLIAASAVAGLSDDGMSQHQQPRISRSHQETETASSSSATTGQADMAPAVVVDHPLPTSAAAASTPNNSDSNVDGDAAEKNDAGPRPDLLPAEEDWKRAERRQHHHRQDGDFGAKTIVSVRKSQSSRGGGPVAGNSRGKVSSQRRR